jgi:acetyl-CoA carboxylase biotin carboxyl carrier protein
MLNEQNKTYMNLKEIQDLLKLVNKLELKEFKMKNGEFEVAIKTKNFSKEGGMNMANVMPIQAQQVPVAPIAAAPVASPAAPAAEEAKAEENPNENLLEVKSPIVGTFYRSPSPEKGPYKKVGDRIEKGEVVCIVEAMKLFNEIESEVSGTIVKVVAEDASPVEYDQVLFMVDPN